MLAAVKKDVILMNVNTYGKDVRLKYCREYILRLLHDFSGDITLLPIPSTKDGVSVYGTGESLMQVCNSMRAGDALVGYEIPRQMRETLSDEGVLTIDVAHDERFLLDNAKLTADGTVGRILTEHDSAPEDLKIGVIGYGRIGQSLLNSLLFFGANVTVFTSKREVRHDLCMLGVSGVDSLSFDTDSVLETFHVLDILINTAPSKLIPESAVESLKSVRIIELASGDNMPPQLYCERFASVPALMYPKSAGKALAGAVIRMLGFNELNL